MTKKAKILLVEDNDINQKYEKYVLEKYGYIVETAESGGEAIEKYKNGEFDIILMDIQLPSMSGIEAIIKIREIEKETGKKVKIAAFSAFTRNEDKKNFLENGADIFIAKPVLPQELHRKIEELISKT